MTEPPKGLDAAVHRCAGLFARRAAIRTGLWREALEAATLGASWREASTPRLAASLAAMRGDCRRGHFAGAPAALALLAEAARRDLGLEAHPEQLMGALAVRRGLLAEMATGEGKTLVIGLAACLAAWSGGPVHVLTANDYLAARDAAWLQAFYARCGIAAGQVLGVTEAAGRRAGYLCDITYSTAKEVTADFLRDRLALGSASDPGRRHLQEMLGGDPGRFAVLRGLHTAIIDEADNALIDEAVTPLIISREEDNACLRQACVLAQELAADLLPSRDYAIDRVSQELTIAPPAIARLADDPRVFPGLWRTSHRRLELVRQALAAREFFHLGKNYVIEEGRIVIVDEFTGRLMPDRKWKQGLHQAIEAKEALAVSLPAETLARMSFQRYFRFYRRLSGLTGTAAEEADEFWQTYGLPVVRIPTHRPCLRRVSPDQIFPDREAKWRAVAAEIEREHQVGRPILIGTRTVAASEHLAALLEARGLRFNLLNARAHREEARIIAEAGERGRITIATNMAGRGTDIALGSGVAMLGGLHVMATERHEARRIDRQLFGRSARQGDPGSACAFVSLDDELLMRHLPEAWRRAAARALLQKMPGAAKMARLLVHQAQAISERTARRQRRQVMEMDFQLDDALSFAK